jgi:hypothetical protein
MDSDQTHQEQSFPPAFAIKDCAVISIATGHQARTISELQDGILNIPPESLYYHFWSGLLQPRFEEREYNNDFAAWVAHHLHERRLAEQLAVLDPTAFPELEDLRAALLDTIQLGIDEEDRLPWLRAERPFDFIRSQIVIFDSGMRVETPKALACLLPTLPVQSVFYHFIDARRREPLTVDDFSYWLIDFGDAMTPLVEELAGIDYYFDGLLELRTSLSETFARYLSSGEGP